MAARRVAGVLALVTLGAGLTACTGGEEPAPTPAASSSAATPSETVADTPLTVGIYGGPRHVAAYREIVDAFAAEHPEVEVEVDVYRNSGEAATAALAALDWGGSLDVFLADDRYLAELVLTDGLEPVDTLLEERGLEYGDDYQRVALTAFSANDRLQCMPAEVSPLVVYVNTALVRRSQPGGDPVALPDVEDGTWTWEEFVEVARAAAALDGPGPVKGAYLPPDIETVTAFVRSAGGDVVDDLLDPDSLTLASDDAREAIAEVAGFARDPSVAPTSEELAGAGPVGMFTDGRLAMFVGTRADLPELRDARGLRFDVLPLPHFGRARSVSLMTGWCLNADSEQLDVAADFVAFAVGEEGSQIAAASGAIVPSGLAAVHDETFTRPNLPPRNGHVYGSAIRRSDPMPYAVDWRHVVEEVESLLTRLWTRPRLDLEETLEERLVRLDEFSEEWLAEPE